MVRFRARAWLEQLLHTHDTPQRTAAAYALGVLLGFSPLLGLHTVLGLVLAFALNLNRVAVLLGVHSNLPLDPRPLLHAHHVAWRIGLGARRASRCRRETGRRARAPVVERVSNRGADPQAFPLGVHAGSSVGAVVLALVRVPDRVRHHLHSSQSAPIVCKTQKCKQLVCNSPGEYEREKG